jgi:hypothetical protein
MNAVLTEDCWTIPSDQHTECPLYGSPALLSSHVLATGDDSAILNDAQVKLPL